MTPRQPVFFLNYSAKVDPVGEVMGPNLFGEMLVALTADWNAQTGKTRVGFAIADANDIARAVKS